MPQPTEMPTLVLQERRPATHRLAPQDVAFLLAEHRTHVELLPAGRRGYYRLTPKGYVGTIVCPDCRLLIRPKVPLENLFSLLDPTAPMPILEDQITPLPGVAGLDFLASRLAELLQERAAAGLHRAYQEYADRGPFLQGQVDLPAQLRGGHGQKDQLHCRFEEFTADIPCNQIPKASAELVMRSALLGNAVRAKLGRALGSFAAVSPIPVERTDFSEVLLDRLTEAYRPLLDLCRLLVESLGPGERSGSTACPSFLLDMEEVFERYVTAGVVRGCAGSSRVTVSAQPPYVANQPADDLPDIHLRPDFTLVAGGQPFLVGDIKWKRLAGSPLVTTDLYQVITYCTALGIKDGVLIYPGRRDRVWKYALARAPLTIEIRSLRVIGKREVCTRSLDRLARSLRSKRGRL
jgi:5-methylcytosine-specific restriction enzyme subunit McrC